MDRPLTGVRVLVPRPPHQASALSERIAAAGGEPVEAATIRTVAGDRDGLAAAVADLAAGRYVGLCLTSANGVVALADAFAAAGRDPAAVLAGLTLVGAVGPRTGALVADRLGVRPTVVPDTATGAHLGAAVPAGTGRVLLPRGDLARPDLDDALVDAGYGPVAVVAYRTVTAERLDDDVAAALLEGTIQRVAATSASTVRGLVQLLGRPPAAGVVSIGPVTSAACAELHVPVLAEADPHDLDGLLAALVASVRPEGGVDRH